MSTSKPRVVFQGEKGAFSQQAIRQLLGDRTEVVPCQTFEDVFVRLRDRRIAAAVIPIENTLAGSVHENYDHLVHFNFQICGETNVRINHTLIAPPGVRFRDLRRVFSHPVALNQCLKFFSQNPKIKKEPFYDTAGSVKMVLEEKLTDAAAIGSAVAAEIYGGTILRRALEDDRRNFTRFFLLRRPEDAKRRLAPVGRNQEWKTTLVFSTRNIPGSLFRALSALALRDINLAKIESRPLRGRPWEYMFYLDLLGRADEVRVQKALGHLEELADFLRVLGSYPKGD
ncbi:MAG TPA: prephenate dehydratase [Bryobacteraceae bacterium]|jgi:prephenate dehydratase|nr:prephenate dehydratase [Bryobacteraceae bacterium]